jgi:hypothetical protein
LAGRYDGGDEEETLGEAAGRPQYGWSVTEETMEHRVKKTSDRAERRPQEQSERNFEQRAEFGRDETFSGEAKFGKKGGIIREIAEQKHRLD